MSASTFERLREENSPLFEVYIGRGAMTGREKLYIGEIDEFEQHDDDLDEWVEIERIPVKPRDALDLVEWIQSGPDELNRALDGDLPADIGRTIGIEEKYFEYGEEVVR